MLNSGEDFVQNKNFRQKHFRVNEMLPYVEQQILDFGLANLCSILICDGGCVFKCSPSPLKCFYLRHYHFSHFSEIIFQMIFCHPKTATPSWNKL